MKLDWNLMRAILGHVEAETLPDFLDDAEALGQWKEGQLLSERLNQAQDPVVRVVYTHLRLLCDNGYIEGVTVSSGLKGRLICSLGPSPSLSLSGYSLLESLRTQGFIDKMKAFAKEKSVPLTFDTIKMIGSAVVSTLLK